MGVTARDPGSREFVNPPAEMQQVVLADIVDLGYEPNQFKKTEEHPEGEPQHKVRLIWQSEHLHPETGEPLTVQKKYTNSLHERSSLRKDVESWKGRKLSTAELKGLDLDTLIGDNAQMNVVHNPVGDKVYANVGAIVPTGRNQVKLTVSPTYVRKQDREDRPEGGGRTGAVVASDPDSEYVNDSVDFAGAQGVADVKQRVVISGDDRSDLVTVARAIAFLTSETVEEIIEAASGFPVTDEQTGEEKTISFKRPSARIGASWVKRSLKRLLKRLDNLGIIAELDPEPIPF